MTTFSHPNTHNSAESGAAKLAASDPQSSLHGAVPAGTSTIKASALPCGRPPSLTSPDPRRREGRAQLSSMRPDREEHGPMRLRAGGQVRRVAIQFASLSDTRLRSRLPVVLFGSLPSRLAEKAGRSACSTQFHSA